MLNLTQLLDYITERHTFDLFRLETLPHYNVESDEEDYRRYLRGEPAPNASVKEPFLAWLRADAAAGKKWRRVHTVNHPLSDYLRYECEWGYAYNVAAGEDIRILDLDKLHLGSVRHEVGDFFMIDRKHVIRSVYDDHYRFAYAQVATEPGPFIALADLLWSTAEPFTTWWANYPQYHRGSQAA